jgi:hypothetical protein
MADNGPKPDERPLVADTVDEAVAKLGQILRANVGFNPAHGDSDGGLHPSVARQFRGMKNKDPGEKTQKALPVCVYHEIFKRAKSKLALPQDITIAWLQMLAYFFYMRSCEYSDVTGERRTKTVCVKNIQFYLHNKLIPNNSQEIFTATTVSITFE